MADARSPSVPRDGTRDDPGIHRRWDSAGTVVLEVVDEVDLITASSLLLAVEDEFDSGCRSLVLDLAGVSFCSVRGLGTFVEVRRIARGRGATVRFAHPSEAVRRTVDLTRSHGVLDGDMAPVDVPTTPSHRRSEPVGVVHSWRPWGRGRAELTTILGPLRARLLARLDAAAGRRVLGLRAPTPGRG